MMMDRILSVSVSCNQAFTSPSFPFTSLKPLLCITEQAYSCGVKMQNLCPSSELTFKENAGILEVLLFIR